MTLDHSVANAAAHFHGNGTNVTIDLNGNTYAVDDVEIGGAPGDNVTWTLKDSGGIAVAAAAGPATGRAGIDASTGSLQVGDLSWVPAARPALPLNFTLSPRFWTARRSSA